MKAVLPALVRPLLEPHLPPEVEPLWFDRRVEATAMIADAEIAWVDMQPTARTAEVLAAAGPALRWVNTIYAGLDTFPLDRLRRQGVILTNGSGIIAAAVADYAVLGVLAAAKRYDEVVRLADRRSWTREAPGTIELDGSSALVIGMGAIGTLIGARLVAFGVAVTGVTRSGRDGTLGLDGWRARLAEFDWVVLAAPSTGATRPLIGAAELAAMKSTAWLVNIARGDLIDQDALVAALNAGSIGGAFLDTVHPEPLPPEHPLWSARNSLHSMHLSGRSQTTMYSRGAALFRDNLAAYVAGGPMRNVVDLDAGY